MRLGKKKDASRNHIASEQRTASVRTQKLGTGALGKKRKLEEMGGGGQEGKTPSNCLGGGKQSSSKLSLLEKFQREKGGRGFITMCNREIKQGRQGRFHHVKETSSGYLVAWGGRWKRKGKNLNRHYTITTKKVLQSFYYPSGKGLGLTKNSRIVTPLKWDRRKNNFQCLRESRGKFHQPVGRAIWLRY